MREREKLAVLRRFHASSSPIEEMLVFLRREQTTKIESVRLLHLATGMALSEAKKAVFLSRTWSDRLASDEVFLDSLLQEPDRVRKTTVAA